MEAGTLTEPEAPATEPSGNGETRKREPRPYIVLADQGDGLSFQRVGGDNGEFTASRASDALSDAMDAHPDETTDDDGEPRWLCAIPASSWNPKRASTKRIFE